MKKTIKVCLIILTVGITSIGKANAQQADSVRRLIDTLLQFSKANSLYSGSADWKKINDSVRAKAASAGTIKEALPAVKLLYQLLGDHHGFITYNNKYYGWTGNNKPLDKIVHAALIKQMKDGYGLRKQMLEKGYGYLLIPNNNPTYRGAVNSIARQIRDSLMALKPEKLKGLVIDLRLNTGGDMYAMIGGLSNLFKPGKLGAFVYPGTKKEEAWSIESENGRDKVYSGDDTLCRINRRGNPLYDLKVVVLIGPYTCSSGEALAISFKGRNHTFFIGEDSGGYTTANNSFQFTSTIGVFVATAVEADRNGRLYTDNVKPDEEITGGDDFNNLRNDLKVKAAIQWLKQK
ncbi:S41 family peptidase [Mucilaginibacter sp. RS28]|uniref:S41 family peptidase n=1 Tax=Mucilaginibacter straminoryzae TaxID=2932774 RepID=A0A9X1X1I4_9SPHI|nr:S41 family peptidase [Mucilaginibacter straminoryzae]MCJ8209096.1 S41 family peptidase [Mucilaginibacter straminoryzae]